MHLYLDSAEVTAWADLMPTGLFRGITTNPLLAQRAGLVYPEIDKAGEYRDFNNVDLPKNLRYLYQHLLTNNFIFGIESSDRELFGIFSRDILKQLALGRGDWEKLVPEGVAEKIIDNRYFGYGG